MRIFPIKWEDDSRMVYYSKSTKNFGAAAFGIAIGMRKSRSIKILKVSNFFLSNKRASFEANPWDVKLGLDTAVPLGIKILQGGFEKQPF